LSLSKPTNQLTNQWKLSFRRNIDVKRIANLQIDRLFTLYDVNRNGVIEHSDYAMVADSTAQALGYAPDSPRMETIMMQSGR
jgi:hypothetical protein